MCSRISNIVDGSGDSITGNVFRPANRAYGVSFGESSAGRLQNEGLVGNSFVPSFGTGNYFLNVANNGQNIKLAANVEGTTGPMVFGYWCKLALSSMVASPTTGPD